MGVVIRTAVIQDAAAIARVQVASWRSTYRGIVPDPYLDSLDVDARAQRWNEALAAQPSFFFVAEDGGDVVGFVFGGKLREPIGGYDAELFAIYLLQQWQGQGIGRRLTQELADAMRHAGFQAMAVWVLEQNPAVEFYKRLGGAMIGRKKIEIGGALLEEIAFGWLALDRCFPRQTPAANSEP